MAFRAGEIYIFYLEASLAALRLEPGVIRFCYLEADQNRKRD